MASESGRINEFADDCHFWPDNPIIEDQPLWMAGHSQNERVTSTADKYMLYITDFNGKQIRIPVKIRKEND